MKRDERIAWTVVAALVAVIAVVHAVATVRVAEMRVRSTRRIAAELEDVWARPDRTAFRGPTRDATAATEYILAVRALEPKLGVFRATGDLGRQLLAPGGPLEPSIAALLAAAQPEIATIVAATRAARCDWMPFARPHDPRGNRWLAARRAATLLLLDGRERRQAGDPRGAAERALECVAFGIDWARDAEHLSFVVGLSAASEGARELGLALEAGAPLPDFAEEIAALRGSIPSCEDALRIDAIVQECELAAFGSGRSSQWGRGAATVAERVIAPALATALQAGWFGPLHAEPDGGGALEDDLAARLDAILARRPR